MPRKKKSEIRKLNKQIVEVLMEKTLEEMCKKLNLELVEWDIGEDLYIAMKQSTKFKKLQGLAEDYDNFYLMAEFFEVRDLIDPRFAWFRNLFNNE